MPRGLAPSEDWGGARPPWSIDRLEATILDARLPAVVPDDEPEARAREVADLLGPRLARVLDEGLNALADRPDLLLALDCPKRLLGLQALVFVHGSDYWDELSRRLAGEPDAPATTDDRERFRDLWTRRRRPGGGQPPGNPR